MVDQPPLEHGMLSGGPRASGAEGTTAQLRRGYAVAAAEALVEYIVRGFRFAIRTADSGERVEPSGAGKRVIFTLPDWDVYTSLLRSHLDAWWRTHRGRFS